MCFRFKQRKFSYRSSLTNFIWLKNLEEKSSKIWGGRQFFIKRQKGAILKIRRRAGQPALKKMPRINSLVIFVHTQFHLSLFSRCPLEDVAAPDRPPLAPLHLAVAGVAVAAEAQLVVQGVAPVEWVVVAASVGPWRVSVSLTVATRARGPPSAASRITAAEGAGPGDPSPSPSSREGPLLGGATASGTRTPLASSGDKTLGDIQRDTRHDSLPTFEDIVLVRSYSRKDHCVVSAS